MRRHLAWLPRGVSEEIKGAPALQTNRRLTDAQLSQPSSERGAASQGLAVEVDPLGTISILEAASAGGQEGQPVFSFGRRTVGPRPVAEPTVLGFPCESNKTRSWFASFGNAFRHLLPWPRSRTVGWWGGEGGGLG